VNDCTVNDCTVTDCTVTDCTRSQAYLPAGEDGAEEPAMCVDKHTHREREREREREGGIEPRSCCVGSTSTGGHCA
jgi:hypothetical protein